MKHGENRDKKSASKPGRESKKNNKEDTKTAETIHSLRERAQRLQRLYATLSQVNQAIVRIKDREALFEKICEVAIKFGKFFQAWIGLVDEKNGVVTPVAFKGKDADSLPFNEINVRTPPFDKGLVGLAFHKCDIVASNDILNDPKMKHWRGESRKYGYRSAVAVPFRFRGKIIGILNLYAKEAGFFKVKEEVRLLREIGSDISFALDNMEAERAKAYMAAIVESSDDAIVAKDLDGIVTSWNLGAQKIFGYKAHEMMDQPILKIIPPERIEEEEHILDQIKQNKPVRIETVRVRKDGKRIDVVLTVSPVRDSNGKVIGASKIVRDITERKLAEEALVRQFNRLNSLREIDLAIASSFDIRVTLDIILQQAISHLNADAAAIILIDRQSQTIVHGASRGFRSNVLHRTQLKMDEGYAGRALRERRTVNISELLETDSELSNALQSAKEDFVDYYSTPLITKDEVKGVLEIYHRSPLDADPEWLKFLEILAGQAAIAIDNAQLFERLQRANADLEKRVAERTIELNQTNAELEHANHAKDEFLATMSHELRTPLNSILGLSETLLEQRHDPLSARQQKLLQTIESSGQHLLELINDVLDLSKIDAGKLDYYPQIVDVNTLCRSSLAFVREQAVRKSIQLIDEDYETNLKIYADPRRLKQILVNILTNAVKFTPDQGRISLEVITDAEEDLVQFSVTDTGIGIAEEDLKRLFQPFIQVDSNLNRQFEGTGLGLTLVERLTDLHGGSVHVESEPGKGSRFTINIPWGRLRVAQEEGIQAGGGPVAEEEPRQPDTTLSEPSEKGIVLLAEDNESNILAIGEYLKSHGYEVRVAHDGLEAIQMAEEIDPDVILMDVQMPGMDGLETMRQLRANSRFASTPIIALTALAMPGDRERCLEAGANEYMSKPVGLKKLVKTIGELLAH